MPRDIACVLRENPSAPAKFLIEPVSATSETGLCRGTHTHTRGRTPPEHMKEKERNGEKQS